MPTLHEEDENTKSHHLSDCKELDETDFLAKENRKKDGAILNRDQNKDFSNLTQISPIPKETIQDMNLERTAAKRQRIEEDNFDNISIDSSTISLSTKKPKLMRTASLTKNLRKSLSFGIMKTPINNIFKSRRHSVDQDVSASASMISMESTFNDTITKPFKEKFRRMRDKASRMMKRDHDTPSKSFINDRSFHFAGTETANESKNAYFPNMSLSSHVFKTPEKGQMIEPKTPRFHSDFQLPKEKNFSVDMQEKNPVIYLFLNL